MNKPIAAIDGSRLLLPELHDALWLDELADTLNHLSERYLVMSFVISDMNKRISTGQINTGPAEYVQWSDRSSRDIKKFRRVAERLRKKMQECETDLGNCSLRLSDMEDAMQSRRAIPNGGLLDRRLISDAIKASARLFWTERVGEQAVELFSNSIAICVGLERISSLLEDRAGASQILDSLRMRLFDWIKICSEMHQEADLRDLDAWCDEFESFKEELHLIENRLRVQPD